MPHRVSRARIPIFPCSRSWLAGGALLLVCIASGCARDRDGLSPVRDALADAPGIAGRLSISTRFRACEDRTPASGTIPVAECRQRGKRPDAGRALAAARAAPDSLSGQLLALLDLAAPDSTGRALDRAISSLRREAILRGNPAPVLADLSAALIVRAERMQAPRDLLEAYEMAQQAVERSPRDPGALYNRALAIDRFGLVDEAIAGWDAYLAIDATSGWANEARRRIGLVRAIPVPLPPPPPNASTAAYRAYAAGEPQGARELGMGQVLAEWGDAALAGDGARANRALLRAEALGTALERRRGGDRSLADAVRTLRAAAGNRALTLILARAHREYGAGRRLYDAGDYSRAKLAFTPAAEANASPTLRDWARVYLGTALVHLRAGEQGPMMLRATAEGVDSTRYPALVARALWSLGNTLNRGEGWETGLEMARTSTRLFSRAGERENEGAVLAVESDARFVLGEPDSGYVAIHRALERLRPYRASLRLHNLLATSADKASLDGLLRTAVRLADEDVQVANRQSAMYSAEALLRRARFLASLHEVALARNDVETARPLVETVHVVVPRRWLEADLHEAEAVSKFRGDPALQTSALDSAAAFFAPLPYRLLPELVGAAEARLAAGDPANAATRLERVMRLLEQRRDSIGMEPRRAAVFDAAREVVDRLVMLKLAEGRAPEALRYLDRARASLAPTGSASEQDTGDPLRSRAGEVVLEYALVADTLLVWTVTDRRVQVTRSAVDTLRLVRTIEEVTTKLEEESGEAEVRPALSQLYEWLIRPVESRLGSAGTSLVFVVDGSLAAVPFAALLEAGSGRYLVEYHPLRFAVSVREASRPPSSERAGEVLFVADPAFVQSKNKLLQPLEQARAEVREVAKEYPNAAILEGANATRRTLLMALPHTALTHFAGHAVFDDARPERSYLVLAPDARDDAGRLTAADLARLDLRNVRLVVLSACRTVRSGRTRASGYTGLSGALLAAGAEGTVGSLWDVDDRATAALMASFHQAYSRIPDATSALRRAQLSLLRVDDPSLRSPAAWAAFRYAGR